MTSKKKISSGEPVGPQGLVYRLWDRLFHSVGQKPTVRSAPKPIGVFKVGDPVVYRYSPYDPDPPAFATVVAINDDIPVSGSVWVIFDDAPNLKPPPYTYEELQPASVAADWDPTRRARVEAMLLKKQEERNV